MYVNDMPKSIRIFTFGLLATSNVGRDPFGEPTHTAKTLLATNIPSQ
ncbi:MAG: hypothetical protein KC434_11485 [Anaerolineales bacterium]|nr:hypothetical protein [Anaerolineales bacterium]